VEGRSVRERLHFEPFAVSPRAGAHRRVARQNGRQRARLPSRSASARTFRIHSAVIFRGRRPELDGGRSPLFTVGLCAPPASVTTRTERYIVTVVEYRVNALYYRFTSGGSDNFEKAAARSGMLGDWSYDLDAGVLRAVPAAEFRERRAARDDLEPHLRDWEQAAFLTTYAYRIGFDYDHADVEEVNPRPGSITVFPETIDLRFSMGTPTIIRGNREYPAPDTAFRRTPLTDALTERLRRVRDREAELPAVGYFVLDSLEEGFGGRASGKRARAATALGVDRAVLQKLGELTSAADPEIGRKAGPARPLTALEREWISAAIVRLVRRVGEHAAGTTTAQITMKDFPTF
jgi:hypothetical protein